MWRIATYLSTLARMEFRDEILVARLCEEAKTLIETNVSDNGTDLVPSNVVCIMNALAKMKHTDEILMEMLCARALQIIPDFNSQEVAMILNAITKLGHTNMTLVTQLSEASVGKLSEFNPQEITITLNGLARLRSVDSELVPILCGRVIQVDEFKWQEISSVLNSLADLEYSNEELLSKLCHVALLKVDEFSVQAIANTLHALAKLQYKNSSLVTRLCEVLALKMSSLECHSLATTLWSLLCCQHYEGDIIQLLWKQLFRLDMSFTKDEDLRNLYQSQLCLSIERPEWQLFLPSGLCKRTADAWKRKASSPSTFQARASSILQSMNVEHVNETERGDFSVDIAMLTTVGPVVIELDGPRHFITRYNSQGKQEGEEYNGNSVFKQRLLEAQGIMVLRVPYFEWNKLIGWRGKAAYLDKKLRPVHSSS